MSSIIRFEDPPPSESPASHVRHAAIAAALKERPGEWALVRESSSSNSVRSLAWQIRSAYNPAYAPTGAFEAVSRSFVDTCRVYARFVGGAE